MRLSLNSPAMTQHAIGLIGGIATGKSLASQFFRDLKIEAIDSDQIARDIVKPGSALLDQIVLHYGKTVLAATGELDRAQLRALIFTDPAERLWLEKLLHPVIRQKIDRAIDAAQGPYCVVAIPLLKRREDYPKLQKILMIDVPLEIELQRLMERDHLNRELAEAIIASQPSRAERLALADIVIVNDQDAQSLQKKIQKLDLEIRQACL